MDARMLALKWTAELWCWPARNVLDRMPKWTGGSLAITLAIQIVQDFAPSEILPNRSKWPAPGRVTVSLTSSE